jgi:hypothetical protein
MALHCWRLQSQRAPTELIEKAGFSLLQSQRERFPSLLWLLGNHYSGVAVPR